MFCNGKPEAALIRGPVSQTLLQESAGQGVMHTMQAQDRTDRPTTLLFSRLGADPHTLNRS